MKTNEYNNRFYLNSATVQNYFDFVNSFIAEFKTRIEIQRQKSSDFSLSLFDKLLDEMYQKIDAINNKLNKKH